MILFELILLRMKIRLIERERNTSCFANPGTHVAPPSHTSVEDNDGMNRKNVCWNPIPPGKSLPPKKRPFSILVWVGFWSQPHKSYPIAAWFIPHHLMLELMLGLQHFNK